MWLVTPDVAPSALWEGPLEPVSDARETLRDHRAPGDEADKDLIDVLIRDAPSISIGRPEVWHLSELYPPEQMPQALRAKAQAKAQEDDFYFVRLVCTFRPRHDETQIEYARFAVRLLPDRTGRQPRAFDLHPMAITREVKRHVQVTFGPSLTFKEVEASAGDLEFGFEYTELQPVISGYGVGEEQPSWDYEAPRGTQIRGSKWMHLLVAAPRGMGVGDAALDLTADVRHGGARLPMLIPRNQERSRDRMRVRLWGRRSHGGRPKSPPKA
ncbi:MAG: hypothetical protein M3176_04265 [Chloroflexota bacterium]|nr:hypothetical protein [Chloroflexota bacterium]